VFSAVTANEYVVDGSMGRVSVPPVTGSTHDDDRFRLSVATVVTASRENAEVFITA
jgi:hypothetical protein